ncbi:hypothetical protein IT397_01800, partial [Candidatus Nomurabacteria bacterium]|nr:hypothetical protein [Candidatus Nomurabacteria bacterium]
YFLVFSPWIQNTLPSYLKVWGSIMSLTQAENRYENISFDLWALGVTRELIVKRGLVLPSPFIFKEEGIEQILKNVKSVVHPDEWERRTDLDNLIREKIFNIFEETAQEYLGAIFKRGGFQIGRRMLKPGEHEIYFFVLSYLAKNGYLGLNVEQTLSEFRGSYAPEVHNANVEALLF